MWTYGHLQWTFRFGALSVSAGCSWQILWFLKVCHRAWVAEARVCAISLTVHWLCKDNRGARFPSPFCVVWSASGTVLPGINDTLHSSHGGVGFKDIRCKGKLGNERWARLAGFYSCVGTETQAYWLSVLASVFGRKSCFTFGSTYGFGRDLKYSTVCQKMSENHRPQGGGFFWPTL